MKKLFLVTLAALAACLAGCSTVSSRIDEKAEIFAKLDPQTQARIRQGLVDVGYTKDMVYMAMGKPDQIRSNVSKDGADETWIYNSYWEQYEGSRLTGYRRHVYFDPQIKGYRVYYEPIRTEIYSARTEENSRVNFKNGNVESIEVLKD